MFNTYPINFKQTHLAMNNDSDIRVESESYFLSLSNNFI